jgi:hypothetical protein
MLVTLAAVAKLHAAIHADRAVALSRLARNGMDHRAVRKSLRAVHATQLQAAVLKSLATILVELPLAIAVAASGSELAVC